MTSALFDDPELRAAMSDYLAASSQLDDAAAVGGDARDLVDLAEAKTLAGLLLRKALTDRGWHEPASVHVS